MGASAPSRRARPSTSRRRLFTRSECVQQQLKVCTLERSRQRTEASGCVVVRGPLMASSPFSKEALSETCTQLLLSLSFSLRCHCGSRSHFLAHLLIASGCVVVH